MRPRNVTRLIGHCGVDSGQLLIIDPCYIRDGFRNEIDVSDFDKEYGGWHVLNAHEGGYAACCAATLGPMRAGEAGEGVAFGSGHGDGCYPVYATYNGDGLVVKVEVFMDGDPYDTEDDEEGYTSGYAEMEDEEDEECAD